MNKTQALMLVGTLCAAAGCGASLQSRGTASVAGASCNGLTDTDRQVAALYAPGNVDRVEPLYREEFQARAIQLRYVAGASLYVPAQPGVTEAYLERVLSCHASSQAPVHPNDPLRQVRVKDVDVVALGQRFAVHIEGADRQAGREIYRRARALQGQATTVDVRQLSSGAQPNAL